MRIYIDSSAYAKYYGKTEFEKGTDVIERMMNEVKNRQHVLFSSYWVLPEAVAAIDSWERKRYVSPKEKRLLYSKLVGDMLDSLEKGHLVLIGLPYERYLRLEFLRFIDAEHLGPGDALHVYTANLIRPDLFVTADLNQIRVARTLGMDSFNPEKQVWH
ncbi:MAG: type II toxin-antitoxin system VapC family toxin [Candidatus Bathyarchaeia archaeon]